MKVEIGKNVILAAIEYLKARPWIEVNDLIVQMSQAKDIKEQKPDGND